MPTAIQPIHYNGIIDSIKDGLCVPFLGAGVNVSSDSYEGLPLAYEVALHMVKPLTTLNQEQLESLTKSAAKDIRLRLAQVISGLDEQQLRNLNEAALDEHLKSAGPLPNLLRAALPDLSRVALHIEVEMGFPYLLKRLREILSDAAREPSPMLKTLTILPLKLIVTANYDRLLERAYGDKPYELVVQPVTGFDDQNIIQLKQQLSLPKGPIIYKIHGSFGENGAPIDAQENSRLILTEEDYIQFLSIVGRPDIGMPELISNKLMRATILFLGYSLQDWDFRTIYKALIEPIDQWRRPKSFAIQKNPPDFWVRYWERKGVTILDVDLYEFASELQKRWELEEGGNK